MGKKKKKQLSNNALTTTLTDAYSLYTTQNTTSCIHHLQSALQQHPNCANLYETLGLVYEDLNDIEKSFHFYYVAACLKKTDLSLWKRLYFFSIFLDLKKERVCILKEIFRNEKDLDVLNEKIELCRELDDEVGVMEGEIDKMYFVGIRKEVLASIVRNRQRIRRLVLCRRFLKVAVEKRFEMDNELVIKSIGAGFKLRRFKELVVFMDVYIRTNESLCLELCLNLIYEVSKLNSSNVEYDYILDLKNFTSLKILGNIELLLYYCDALNGKCNFNGCHSILKYLEEFVERLDDVFIEYHVNLSIKNTGLYEIIDNDEEITYSGPTDKENCRFIENKNHNIKQADVIEDGLKQGDTELDSIICKEIDKKIIDINTFKCTPMAKEEKNSNKFADSKNKKACIAALETGEEYDSMIIKSSEKGNENNSDYRLSDEENNKNERNGYNKHNRKENRKYNEVKGSNHNSKKENIHEFITLTNTDLINYKRQLPKNQDGNVYNSKIIEIEKSTDTDYSKNGEFNLDTVNKGERLNLPFKDNEVVTLYSDDVLIGYIEHKVISALKIGNLIFFRVKNKYNILTAILKRIANVLFELGNYKEALEYYLKAMQYDPLDFVLKQKINELYIKTGETEVAKKYVTNDENTFKMIKEVTQIDKRIFRYNKNECRSIRAKFNRINHINVMELKKNREIDMNEIIKEYADLIIDCEQNPFILNTDKKFTYYLTQSEKMPRKKDRKKILTKITLKSLHGLKMKEWYLVLVNYLIGCSHLNKNNEVKRLYYRILNSCSLKKYKMILLRLIFVGIKIAVEKKDVELLVDCVKALERRKCNIYAGMAYYCMHLIGSGYKSVFFMAYQRNGQRFNKRVHFKKKYDENKGNDSFKLVENRDNIMKLKSNTSLVVPENQKIETKVYNKRNSIVNLKFGAEDGLVLKNMNKYDYNGFHTHSYLSGFLSNFLYVSTLKTIDSLSSQFNHNLESLITLAMIYITKSLSRCNENKKYYIEKGFNLLRDKLKDNNLSKFERDYLNYNLGRAYNQFKILGLAEFHYKKCIDSEDLDLQLAALFNLHIIYRNSNNKKLCKLISDKIEECINEKNG